MNKPSFTLIEVLVAMVIVTLLTTTGIFSYRMVLNQLNRNSIANFNDSIVFSQLKALFNSTYFYIIEKKNLFEPEKFKYIYLFKKSDSEIVFVSQNPIYNKNLSLIKLFFQDNNLYYQEEPIYSQEQNYKEPKFFDYSHKHILIENIQNGSFFFETPIDLPKDFKTDIPKLIHIKFFKDNRHMEYIFSIKNTFYKRYQILENKRLRG